MKISNHLLLVYNTVHDIMQKRAHFAVLTFERFILKWPGPGCSKLRLSLVNISLKFQMLISQIRQ